jgi:hypothetical protein
MLPRAACCAPSSGFPPGALGRRNADNSVPSDPRVRPWRRPRASPAGPRRTRKPSRNRPFRAWLRTGRVAAIGGHRDGLADGDADGGTRADGDAGADGLLPAGAAAAAAFCAALRAASILAT